MNNFSKYRKIKVVWDETEANKSLKNGWDIISVIPIIYSDTEYGIEEKIVIKTDTKFIMGKTKMGSILHD